MKLAPLLVLLALAPAMLPAASATHFVQPCMSIWITPPPGWSVVCTQADWALHNPLVPVAGCVAGELAQLDIRGALACA